MNKTQKANYDDLVAQAEMFDMAIDLESPKPRLIPKPKPRALEPTWLTKWKYAHEDKQWDHEMQNNDGGE